MSIENDFTSLREPHFGARPGCDALPLIVRTVTPDGACDYVNARWLEFTGRTLAGELGFGWLERLHPEDRAACEE